MFTDQAALVDLMGETSFQRALATVHRQMDTLAKIEAKDGTLDITVAVGSDDKWRVARQATLNMIHRVQVRPANRHQLMCIYTYIIDKTRNERLTDNTFDHLFGHFWSQKNGLRMRGLLACMQTTPVAYRRLCSLQSELAARLVALRAQLAQHLMKHVNEPLLLR
jgi:hypothetical protein